MRRDIEDASTKGSGSPAKPANLAEAPRAKDLGAKADVKPLPVLERRAPGDRTEERVRMSKRRATIAKRLLEVQSTAAMLTTFNEVDMSAVQAVREKHKAAFKERHGINLGLTSFFVKAAIGALRAFPGSTPRSRGTRWC